MEDINIINFLDSTYLRTSEELAISDVTTKDIVISRIKESINLNFKCVMIRPEFVAIAKQMIELDNSNVQVGTVIDFPLGDALQNQKKMEAQLAIDSGVDELDFVCNYNAFKRCNYTIFDKDIIEGTRISVKNNKVAKWIIETGALSAYEIQNISERIVKLIQDNFPEDAKNMFIKTSTGYYGGYGARVKDIKRIKSVSGDLQIKASGGVSTLKDCLDMISAGANRIGTSKANLIYSEYLNES